MKTVTVGLFVLIMTATSSFAWGEKAALLKIKLICRLCPVKLVGLGTNKLVSV